MKLALEIKKQTGTQTWQTETTQYEGDPETVIGMIDVAAVMPSLIHIVVKPAE